MSAPANAWNGKVGRVALFLVVLISTSLLGESFNVNAIRKSHFVRRYVRYSSSKLECSSSGKSANNAIDDSTKNALYAIAPSPDTMVNPWTSILGDDSDNSDDDVDVEISEKFSILDGLEAPTVSMASEDLQEKWIDICVEQIRPQDMDLFSLHAILPLILRDDTVIELRNKTQEAITEDEIYITEQELQRLWIKNSDKPMGKPLTQFSVEEALLLLPDAEADELMAPNLEFTQYVATDSPSVSSISLLKEDGDIINDGEVAEYVITENELQRIWDIRAEVSWGLPSKEFDEKLALLQLDDDDDEDYESNFEDEDEDSIGSKKSLSLFLGDEDDAEFDDETGIELGSMEGEVVDESELKNADDGVSEFWDKFKGKSNSLLRDTLKKVYADLEDKTYLRPAWKKDRHILTPDIDTQSFEGDIMNSNTYMTQRIPANWNDPELEEMSETYLSTGTMAWPGEEETDFNEKVPVWDLLNLPFTPKLILQEVGSIEGIAENIATDEEDSESEQVDWNTYDFSEGEEDLEQDSSVDDSIDVEDFFNKLSTTDSGSALEEEEETAEDVMGPMTPSADFTLAAKFTTPEDWVNSNSEYANHVGFDHWNNQDEANYFDADDAVTVDDIATAMSMKHVLGVIGEYLVDHTAINEAVDDKRYWERMLWTKFTGDDVFEEEIPVYMTPDKDRGIEYSDEIIEMKGKITLAPYMPPPAELWANDSFHHNDEFETINKVGSIREQYEWQPDTTLTHEIDEKVVERIQPVLKYINHAGTLLSTKDGIIVMDYMGQMRHIIGIRATMLKIAKECCPEIKDIRLETEKGKDKFDS